MNTDSSSPYSPLPTEVSRHCMYYDTARKCVCAPLQELGEVPERRLDNIAELREKIAEAEQRAEFRGMVFARRDDRFLLRFLRARKFQVERALQLYLNYYKYRHKHAHLLGELSLQSVEHVLQRDFFALLDTPTNSGSKMLVVFPSRWVTGSVTVVT